MLGFTSITAQQSCNSRTCAQRDGDHSGGDDNPLGWRSGQHVVQPPRGSLPEFRCFERTVRNASPNSVTLIHWEVARYFRNLLPAGQSACDAMVVEGSVANPHPAGPLYWGPGRAQYATQVYAPKIWPMSATRWGPEIPFSADWPKEPLALWSTLMVFPQSAGARGAVIELRSEVTYSGKGYAYAYTISHDSTEALLVKWAVVRDDGAKILDAQRDFALGGDPVAVSAQRPMIFHYTSATPPKSGIGLVTILDRAGNELAQGLASSFGPSTGTIRE